MRKQTELLERMTDPGTNLSVGFYGWFPDVLQSESLAVVDQRDGLDVLPELRGDQNTSRRERQKEEERRRPFQTFSDCLRHSRWSISVCRILVFMKSCLLADIRRPLGSRGPITSYQMGLPSLSYPHIPPDTYFSIT